MDVTQVVFVRKRDDTLYGEVRLGDSSLELTTLSHARADLLRDRIEKACGVKIRAGLRSHSDPMPGLEEIFNDRHADPGERRTAPEKDEAAAAFAVEYKKDYYARWLDEPVPALGDLTPREATKTAAGRRKLIPLLDDFAFMEARLPENERFDVETLRTELGLDRKR